jgi:outer membrane protein assembly factor BamB
MDPPLTHVWSTSLGGGVVSYPIIVGTRIFVVAGGYQSSSLYALDAGTGHVLWSQSSPSGYGGWVGVAYDNGVLFVVPYYTPGFTKGEMFAFSAVDGHQLWSATLPVQYGYSSAPTAVNGIVYTGGAGSGGTVYAVRESDGTLLWTQEVENGDNSAPAVTSDGVYVSYACPQSYKFNPTSGDLIWHFSGQCEGGGGDSVAIYNGQVYVRDLVDNYQTDGITLNTSNGLYSGGFNSRYSPTFWQGTAFYTEGGSLSAVDLSTSQTLWTATPGSDSYSCAPIVVNGIVYAGTAAGNFYGYAAASGSQVFSTKFSQGISCSEGYDNPLPGFSAGNGMLLVPAGSELAAFQFTNFGAWQFVPVTPCRLVDTRQTHNPILGGTSQNFPVTQLGSCGIPISSTAFSLNVTVAPQKPLGYLTVWPTGQDQPTVSTMNSPDGRIKANAAIVPSGFDSGVSVYASDTTDLILDIDGYFAPPNSQSLQFYPLTPCRVVDTRSGSKQPKGLGPPSLQTKQQRDLPILSSACLQGITNPQAYSFNVTVVPSPAGQPLGYLTVWPSNQNQPTVSTLNNPTATVVANAAIVPAAPDGDIDVYAFNSTDLIIDINGYFAAPAQNGLSMYPAAPCRVLDTRNNNGPPFQNEKTVNVVNSACAPPSTAQAYIMNATVVPPGQMPYLTLWPDGESQPVVSTLNAYDGFITSNMALVPTTNGSIDAYAAGLTQMILDMSGYFAP